MNQVKILRANAITCGLKTTLNLVPTSSMLQCRVCSERSKYYLVHLFLIQVEVKGFMVLRFALAKS